MLSACRSSYACPSLRRYLHPLIASILFPSMCSCSSSLSATLSFCPLLPPQLACPQCLMHTLPEWVYQVDVVGTMVVVGLAGRLFHIYDVWQMCVQGTELVQWHESSLKFMTHAAGTLSTCCPAPGRIAMHSAHTKWCANILGHTPGAPGCWPGNLYAAQSPSTTPAAILHMVMHRRTHSTRPPHQMTLPCPWAHPGTCQPLVFFFFFF